MGQPPGLGTGRASGTATSGSNSAETSNAGSSSSVTQSPTTGSVRRAGLRDRRTRRSRSPTALPVQAAFRATLIAPEVAGNVQPTQTGIPDGPLPVARAPIRPSGPGTQTISGALAAPGALGTPIVAPVALSPRALVEDPYAPLGVRVGNLYLFPLVGESIGYDSNPNRTQFGKRGSFVSQTEGELRVQSDWSRHELTGSLRGAYDEYPGNPAANRPEGSGRVGLRLDASRDTQIDAEGHFLIDTQRPGSPDLNAPVTTRPVIYTEGASVGVTQRFNRLIGSLRGTIDRADFDDADLGNGVILDQSDRNLTQYGVRGRLGYELKPGLVPFVEVSADTRVYDRRVDSAGFARSSDGLTARLGTTFEITRLLTGEVSAGAVRRSYDDARLRDLVSPVADAALSYALTPLTTVRANAQATVDETTIPGSNGIRSIRGGLEVSHELRRNLTLTAGLTAADYEYQGVDVNERSFGALLRADYRLNRQIALRASYSYETLSSTVPGSSYNANVLLFGIRLQP